MNEITFQTNTGTLIPSVTAAEMREVDRVAVEDFGLEILQMMENAGRDLASAVQSLLENRRGLVTILAGTGGNGGGGLCAARHLHNHGYDVAVTLTKSAAELSEAASRQLQILLRSGIQPIDISGLVDILERSDLVVDALIGYSLLGEPTGRVAELIDLANRHSKTILSLDVPSGFDATTGAKPGAAIIPKSTMTLALPKSGLHTAEGELILADIGIPTEVYQSLGIQVPPIFERDYLVPLSPVA